MVKVLIVEDSPLIREIIKSILAEDEDFQVIGEVESGEDAVEFVRKETPDIITMDVNLKGKDGFYATREIMAENPVPIVIMSTLFNPKNEEQVFEALEEGALAVCEKPKALGSPEFEDYSQRLRHELKLLSKVKRVRRKRKKEGKLRKFFKNHTEDIKKLKSVKLVVMGASTGGPQILKEIFTGLREDFNLPIVVVQHMVAGFLNSLVGWLNVEAKLNVKITDNGELLQGGTIYFAPDNFHLIVKPGLKAELVDIPPVHSCKPSISVLFDSVAKSFKNEVVAILLTGMGKDGAEELLKIKIRGGFTIAQDEESSVVYGMPRVAKELNAARLVASPKEIVDFLNNLAGEK